MSTKETVKALEEIFNDFEAEIDELKTKLLYAEDAASKSDLARQQAGGMELEIKELKEENAKLMKVLQGAQTTLQKLGSITDESRIGWTLKAIDAALTKGTE